MKDTNDMFDDLRNDNAFEHLTNDVLSFNLFGGDGKGGGRGRGRGKQGCSGRQAFLMHGDSGYKASIPSFYPNVILSSVLIFYR